MRTIKVRLNESSHNILIGNNLLASCGKILKKLGIGEDAFIIANSLVKAKYGTSLARSLKKYGFSLKFRLIPDTEKSKSLPIALSIISELSKYDKGRKIFIISLGGGVTGDISGFVASIYKRGIPYIQIPTTLLAQIDSSIGGKTAVDLAEGKNLVGAFYQPRLILSDTATLNSLNPRQIKAGLAEAIKYGIIKDKELFTYLEKNYKGILRNNSTKAQFLVYRCSKIKARIIEQDEKEKKEIRTILNFGHTIGHAIEAAGRYNSYNHGEAIALGMIAATYISLKTGLIGEDVYIRIKKLIKKVGLPVTIKNIPHSKIISAHYRDKKFIGRQNRFVLIKGIGRTIIVKNVRLEVITQALKELKRLS